MENFSDLKTKELVLNNLRLIMDHRGLSYKDLADLVGFSKQQVSNIFNGETDGINTSTVDKISAALGLDDHDLFNPNFKNKLK